MTTRYIVKVENGERAEGDAPSKGPVYRSIYAKDGFPPLPDGLETCWDLFAYFSPLLVFLLERHAYQSLFTSKIHAISQT